MEGIRLSGWVKNSLSIGKLLEVLADSLNGSAVRVKEGYEILLCYPMHFLLQTTIRERREELQAELPLTRELFGMGPGYYALLRLFLRKVEEHMLTEAHMEDSFFSGTDEDFENLKHLFEERLRTFLEGKGDRDGNLFLGVRPDEIPVQRGKDMVFSYTGAFRRRDLENLNPAEAARLLFLWPEKDKDAYFYRNTALYLLTSLLPVEERDEESFEAEEVLLSGLREANRKDPSLALPLETYTSIESLGHEKEALEDETPDLLLREDYSYRTGERDFLLPEQGVAIRLNASYLQESEGHIHAFFPQGKTPRPILYFGVYEQKEEGTGEWTSQIESEEAQEILFLQKPSGKTLYRLTLIPPEGHSAREYEGFVPHVSVLSCE